MPKAWGGRLVRLADPPLISESRNSWRYRRCLKTDVGMRVATNAMPGERPPADQLKPAPRSCGPGAFFRSVDGVGVGLYYGAMIKMDDREIKKLERDLKDFKDRAYPFATKATVNGAAFDAQRTAKAHVTASLVLRNQFTTRSIQVEQTRTLHVKKQMAVVGSVAPYMEDQEFGATVRKKGRHGVPIPTSYAAGQPMGQVPRTKLPRKANKLENIQLRKRLRHLPRKQRAVATIKEAAKTGKRYVFLDLESTRGIFRVFGRRENADIRMVYNLDESQVRVPREPWLAESVELARRRIPSRYLAALRYQIQRHRIFK